MKFNETVATEHSSLPQTYRDWVGKAWHLLQPLARLMEPGRAQLPIRGLASDHDANADRLETFARPCLLAALWLQAATDAKSLEDSSRREEIARWFREGLVAGSDPEHPDYWGPCANFHQNGVEMGLLAVAIQITEKWLWQPFPKSAKEQIAHWLGSVRGTGHVWNNHMYFGVFVLEFLRHVGMERPGDAESIAYFFREMETMYRGGGWFMDGMNEAVDYYNAYSWNYYGLLWSYLHGHTNPERAELWSRWAGEFLEYYHHFFAAGGEHPAFGRSITYRFNTIAPFSLAVLLGVSPLPPGQARRLCRRNLEFFLAQPIYQEQGCLSLGWTDEFPEMVELYSCAGSPYWAAKAFSTLLIPPQHAFWKDNEIPLASEGEDFSIPMEKPGMVIRSCDGEVEILNAGSQINPGNKDRYGPWKWGKFTYRTGFGFQIGFHPHGYPPDSALTARPERGDKTYGRHATIPILVERDHLVASYALGDKIEQFNVAIMSYLWWRAGWVLHLHYFNAFQPAVLQLGSYSLPGTSGTGFEKKSAFPSPEVWNAEGKGVKLQALAGFSRLTVDQRTSLEEPRSHIQAPFHTTLVLQTEFIEKEGFVAALSWAGRRRDEAESWTLASGAEKKWVLQHPVSGRWEIRNEALPELDES